MTVSGSGDAVPEGLIARQVEPQAAGLQDALLAARGLQAVGRAAEQHLHAGGQLAHREGLAEVVVRPQLQAQHAVELLVPRGEEEDGQPLGEGAQAPAELQAVHARHE